MKPNSTDKPTLLVFTLPPCSERERKRLLPGHLAGRELELHRMGLSTAVQAGLAAGCRVEVSSPSPLSLGRAIHQVAQPGRTFGDRLRRAIRASRATIPGRPLIVVGSDAPRLTAGHVATTLSLLRDDPQQVVIGPSPDGGFYLLASCRPLDHVLRTVRWCGSNTRSDLLAALQGAGIPYLLLDPVADLDRPEDLTRWLLSPEESRGACGALRRILLEQLALLCRPRESASWAPIWADSLPLGAGRAPPA